MSGWRSSCKRILPESVQDSIRGTSLFKRRRARRFAGGPKRLDVCAAQVASLLHTVGGLSLDGATCLEIGCGWVLSHAVAMHLLGARRVIATDIVAMAYPQMLRRAIGCSTLSLVRDLLAAFTDHAAVRRRLDRLVGVRRFTFETLRELGIEYVAPVDLAKQALGEPVDFIYSASVLEHVPAGDVEPLLRNLSADLSPGGTMLHCIHLEDHQDLESDPFRFLAEPAERFTPMVQGSRGNRIRRSGWLEILARIGELDTRPLYQWQRLDRPLPPTIDPSVRYNDEEDLRTSHLGLFAVRRGT